MERTESGRVRSFAAVLAEEHAAIAARRAAQILARTKELSARPVKALARTTTNQVGDKATTTTVRYVDDGPKYDAPTDQMFDTSGVALSGGGIRSAAFCLGALQALGAGDLIRNVDYLSTVSGGGYIGSSLSAAMSVATPDGKPQQFPFGAPGKIEDSRGVHHLRDYSNYLLPRGRKTLLRAIAVVGRGLAANVVFVTAALFLCAWVTILAYPDDGTLLKGSFIPRAVEGIAGFFGGTSWIPLNGYVGAWPYALTLWVFAGQLGYMILWGLFRSLDRTPGSDVSGGWLSGGSMFLRALVIVAALDLQPLAIAWLLGTWESVSSGQQPSWWAGLVGAMTAISAAVSFFRKNLAEFLGTSNAQSGFGVAIRRVLAVAVVWLAALALPLALWMTYLALCAIGMSVGGYVAAEDWLASVAQYVPGLPVHAASAYGEIALIFLLLSSCLSANANSLHRFYRDKLSKAFLFDPFSQRQGASSDPMAAERHDLAARDDLKLEDINRPTGGPFHVINTTINLQHSRLANRRGRNAGFFTFSSLHVGGEATGYVPTSLVSTADANINLGTAMAISGAAVSSNMGSVSIAALAPTLALLNFRLGYWMINPRNVVGRGLSRSLLLGIWYFLSDPARWLRFGVIGGDVANFAAVQWHNSWHNIRRFWSDLRKSYLFAEMFGLLDETKPYIYLTDGGHIENLGLYTLLKRRCDFIVVVDAEADAAMEFPALSALERYARIDLGVRIDLPWGEIGKPKRDADGKTSANPAPHCAIGIIQYPGGEKGALLYVKSCVTGDEADYIAHYRRHNPSFPHETTGDQFFSEEQFENYRALGFHALYGFLYDGHDICWPERSLAQGELWGPAPDANKIRSFVLGRLQ